MYKGTKANLKHALKLLNKANNNVSDQHEEIENETEPKINVTECIKKQYKKGLIFFSKLSTRITNDIMVGANMAGLCVLIDERFVFSVKFSYIVTYQYICYLEDMQVFGMIGETNKFIETVSEYAHH